MPGVPPRDHFAGDVLRAAAGDVDDPRTAEPPHPRLLPLRELARLGDRAVDVAREELAEPDGRAGRRTRAVTRQLRDVETLDLPEVPALLELVGASGDEDDDDTVAESAE